MVSELVTAASLGMDVLVREVVGYVGGLDCSVYVTGVLWRCCASVSSNVPSDLLFPGGLLIPNLVHDFLREPFFEKASKRPVRTHRTVLRVCAIGCAVH